MGSGLWQAARWKPQPLFKQVRYQILHRLAQHDGPQLHLAREVVRQVQRDFHVRIVPALQQTSKLGIATRLMHRALLLGGSLHPFHLVAVHISASACPNS